MIGKVLRLGDQGYRKLDQPPPAPIERSAPPATAQRRRRRHGSPAIGTDRDRKTWLGAVTMAAKRKIGAPTPKAIDDIWQRRATAAAIVAVREMIRDGGAIPPATPVSRLSDIELGWLTAAACLPGSRPAPSRRPPRAGIRS